MTTPNGRFKTNTRLCLSISDFHPDTWNPAWSVATILTGLLSFMLETTPTLGSTESSNYEKEQLARNSLNFNLKNKIFQELFPDVCIEINTRLIRIQQQLQLQKEQKEKDKITNQTNNTGDNEGGDGGDNQLATTNINNTTNENSNWQSICSNLMVLIGFAIFALIVNYVIKNINN